VNDLNVIDQFMSTFIRYIDSGFGLLGGDVRFLTTVLIGIDITVAGLFWAMGGEDNVLGRLIRKILYVGAFAFILNRFAWLADILVRSFAQAGITAGGGALTADDLLKPGRLAGIGFSAAWPLLDQAADLLGFTSFFDNFLTIAILLFAWAVVILAFFVLAVQMFVCIIEFKLVSLAGFILVPFALWNRTGFLAERVLGHVVSSGIKVMVLGVIVGIGSGFFGDFTSALQGSEPDIGQAMSLVLASLALFGLGIFAPSVASGLAAGAPQLGAGAALGATMGAGAASMLAGGAAFGAARLAGGAALGAVRAATSLGAGARTAYALGKETASSPSAMAGLTGAARAGAGVLRTRASSAIGLGEAASGGRQAAWNALHNTNSPPPTSGGGETAPAWARALQAGQSARHRRQMAVHALSQGDRGAGGGIPDIKERSN